MTAAGIQRFAGGGVVPTSTGALVSFRPHGTDTVPAMLTPGEMIFNAQHQHRLNAILSSVGASMSTILSGRAASGGHVRSNGIQAFQAGGRVLPFDRGTTTASATGAFSRSDAADGAGPGSITEIHIHNDIKAWDGASVRDAVLRPGGITDMMINSLAQDERGRGTVVSRVVRKTGGRL